MTCFDGKHRSPKLPKQTKTKNKLANRIVRVGMLRSPWSDVYHQLLVMPWPLFLLGVFVSFLAINSFFALLYLLGGDGISNAEPGSFFDAFFFSVQTISTIGYGAMSPQTMYADVLVAIESVTGLSLVAMSTGLMFARFARPSARVTFSHVAVITPHNGTPTLMFRAANHRYNQILEAKLWVVLLRTEVTLEGETIRRFYDLQLVRRESPMFALTWTAMHPITESSPFYGKDLQALEAQETEILVILTGLDETFGQTIHARHSYGLKQIFWNHRLVDIVSRLPDGRRKVDYRYFHQVEPI
ncbi:Ion transport 2 domain protein [Thalassoporum mexicanum PCC 7367]|uniref:ion channel n=1 Tax=Thalassoporum mexicanum TaxID=3457544 RepID=UPI00029F9EB6|nr:ion channel [Pseudanabaena sp. PCC 7367]AFY70323.1 Ion transport 2 domain protein [Pseudanabaena sp. PCC 7367]